MPRIYALALLALLPLSLALGAAVVAADLALADRIEEDWEVVIATPDATVTSPQISTTMKADPGSSPPVAVFSLNYRDSPSFLAGGVQVKIRDGDQALDTASQGSGQLATSDETVTWTQRLSLDGGDLKYKVTSGVSTSLGAFGGDDQLSVSFPTTLTSLAGYGPTASVQGSGPSFGSNRVTRMTLLRVRYYQGKTLLATDGTARAVELTY